MNCANHTERMATAFCQNCGKPICEECCRRSEGLVLCDPCWVARHASSQPGPSPTPPAGEANPGTSGWTRVQASTVPVQGIPYGSPAYGQTPAPFASPVLAGLLGFIPGVGAMYNGQFIKALLHVVIFIVLIGATEHFDLAGILIPAWIFYQVFDAAHTASARRDGRPLPDPLGILDLSQRLGPQTGPPTVFQGSAQGTPQSYPSYQTSQSSQPPPPGPSAWAAPVPPVSNTATPGAASAFAAPATDAPYSGAPYVGAPGFAGSYAPIPSASVPSPVPGKPGEPVGAIVLIVVGLLFLLSTMHVFDFDWITRGWPVLLLVLGGWLLWRRARPDYTLPPMPQPPRAGAWASDPGFGNTPPGTPGTALQRNSLSILSPEPHPDPHSDVRTEPKEDAE